MLFAIQTLWQFPHFYGLAWRHRDDYLNGGYVSFPLWDETGSLTAAMIKPYLMATVALPLVSLRYTHNRQTTLTSTQITTLASFAQITTLLELTNPMFLLDGGMLNYMLWSSFKKFEKVRRTNHDSFMTSKVCNSIQSFLLY